MFLPHSGMSAVWCNCGTECQLKGQTFFFYNRRITEQPMLEGTLKDSFVHPFKPLWERSDYLPRCPIASWMLPVLDTLPCPWGTYSSDWLFHCKKFLVSRWNLCNQFLLSLVFSVWILVILVLYCFHLTCMLSGNQVPIPTCFRDESELLRRENTSGTFGLVDRTASLHGLALWCFLKDGRSQETSRWEEADLHLESFRNVSYCQHSALCFLSIASRIAYDYFARQREYC